MNQALKHIRHHKIDKQKWDAQLLSFNGSVYASSGYLDIVSPRWEALIAEDYSLLMPLPVNRKAFIPRILRPPFCQQLGIYAKERISEEVVIRCLSEIPHNYIDYSISNEVDEFPPFHIMERSNIVLNLDNSYQNIRSGYNQNTKRNIQKARKAKVYVEEYRDVDHMMSFKEMHVPFEMGKREQQVLPLLIRQMDAEGKLDCQGAFYKGELVAFACFLHSPYSRIMIQSISSKEGFELSAMFMLIDQYIETNANQPLILDFEGSMIKGVARFYHGFGGMTRPYYRIKKNTLPYPIKWILT